MTDLIDYEIDEDWDMQFTEWDDFAVATDGLVLLQNFALLAEQYVHEYVGENITVEDEVRLANRLEAEYEDRDSVDSCEIYQFDVTDGTLSFTVLINSTEYNWQEDITV